MLKSDGSIPSFGSKRFATAKWKFPYPGIQAQYREARPLNSTHVLSREDGTVESHVDWFNPDMGYPLMHFCFDTPVGRMLVMGCCVIAAIAMARRIG